MKKHVSRLALLAAAATTLSAPAGAIAGARPARGVPVTVRVEGAQRELAYRAVSVKAGTLHHDGGSCPERSAAGALDSATRHDWTGKFYASLHDFFVTSILGESYASNSSRYWSLFVDGRAASTGACGAKLHPGEELLFAAVPASGTALPLLVRGPAQARPERTATFNILAYDAKGRARPVSGAKLAGAGSAGRSSAAGRVTLTFHRSGRVVLFAEETGYVRARFALRVTAR